MDRADEAKLLAQLTAGWTPMDGHSTDELTEARRAIASAILAGKNAAEILPSSTTVSTSFDPVLASQFAHLFPSAKGSKTPTSVGVIRSASATSLKNPAGITDWARSANVVQSFGPFKNEAGFPQWVDLIRITVSERIAFGDPSHPFAVVPVEVFAAISPTTLKLGGGSVWFLAKLLNPSVDPAAFTGFAIQNGTLTSTLPFELSSGTYVVPVGATLTLQATLAAAAPSIGSADNDSAACTFTPPATAKINFTVGGATVAAVDTAAATAYGTSVALNWNKGAVAAVPDFPLLSIPCDVVPASFHFAAVESTVFAPSGTAPVASGGWALALVTANIAALPEASGAGVGVLALGPGANLVTGISPMSIAVKTWFLEISSGKLYALATGSSDQLKLSYQVWQEAAPSQRRSSVEFETSDPVSYGFLASAAGEVLITTGLAAVHIDRPISANGRRYRFGGPATLLLGEADGTSELLIIAQSPASAFEAPSSIALENALIGIAPPQTFLLAAELAGDAVASCTATFYFQTQWLLPTLPDPYAASFDLSIIPDHRNSQFGRLAGIVQWLGGDEDPSVSFVLYPATQNDQAADNSQSQLVDIVFGTAGQGANLMAARSAGFAALLDLSTKVDQFGVAVTPQLTRGLESQQELGGVSSNQAQALAVRGMSLVLNGGLVTTFALPQESWEPMESVTDGMGAPLVCAPANDGFPLLVSAPNLQQLVALTPAAVLQNNIRNVEDGRAFAAVFSLPFGLNAFILQRNAKSDLPNSRGKSTFLLEDGEFRKNAPQFDAKPAPSGGASPSPSGNSVALSGAEQLTVIPPNPTADNAGFRGTTHVDTTGSTTPPSGYGYDVLSKDVGQIFETEFGSGVENIGVPLRRIDFSGYGASIFSDWNNPGNNPPEIIKVQFDTTIGRTAHEVVKALTMLYPYCVRLVRTITMQRQNAGWMQRTDSGWIAASQGVFDFPGVAYANSVHTGTLSGVFNVRNIREIDEYHMFPPTPPGGPVPGNQFVFRKVLFDADIGVDNRIHVTSGGFPFNVVGFAGPSPTLVPSRELVGYIQLGPTGASAPGPSAPPPTPDPVMLQQLFKETGPLRPGASCVVQLGAFGGKPGTNARCTAFEVDMVDQGNDGNPGPALGAAMLAAPQIPRSSGWGMGHRKYTEPAPAILPNDFPLPIVQPKTNRDYWFLANVGDVLRLSQPDDFYSLVHSTGTNKILFEQPRIPVSNAIAAPPPVPGLQFAKPAPPGAPKPGAAPVNNGSPNLADVAALLNSTGLFPDIASVMSLIQGAVEQIHTVDEGFQYSKTYNFDPNQKVTIIDLSLIRIDLQYSGQFVNRTDPAKLTYTVDSSKTPTWALDIGPLSFKVIIPAISKTEPLLTISGGFHADEHTAPGLTNLDVSFGSALSVLEAVFNRLSKLAQFLPGGATANLDVALGDGKLTVRDTFSIADLPLGLGDLTDVSLDMGLTVQLSPLSVDLSVGLGSPDNPFNWIVSPLAGNGMIVLGVRDGKPDLTMQAGIGLGLAIDLAIASGSASVVIAFQIEVDFPTVTLMAILTGNASVDVLDGLASASVTLSAAIGISVNPLPPDIEYSPALPSFPPTSITIKEEKITLMASVSVGIHLSVCWVASVDWDGSWEFSQSITTPEITVSV